MIIYCKRCMSTTVNPFQIIYIILFFNQCRKGKITTYVIFCKKDKDTFELPQLKVNLFDLGFLHISFIFIKIYNQRYQNPLENNFFFDWNMYLYTTMTQASCSLQQNYLMQLKMKVSFLFSLKFLRLFSVR